MLRKPLWLKQKLPKGPVYGRVTEMLSKSRLHTVCQEANCPNRWECFSANTATFLIMGGFCTRDCRFCAVNHGKPEPIDYDEPERVAEASERLGLRYVVVTSVTRDDLSDGGASVFVQTIRKIRERIPDALVELLVPDFQGNLDALQIVMDANPNVLNHNIETVERLYPHVRPDALYLRSLNLLSQAKNINPSILTKSGVMLGLGETAEELYETIQDLRNAGCRILTLGQYLQPTVKHLPVERFISPEEFDRWREIALKIGFDSVAAGPLVRSSYHAKELALSISC